MKLIKINCAVCNISFDKRYAEYNRQKKNNRHNFYCSKQCSINGVALTQTVNTNIIRECLYCKKTFTSTTHKKHKKCCSKICAYKYSQSCVDTKKISDSIKKYYQKNPTPIKKVNCVICNNEFVKTKTRTKTCTLICYKKLISKNATQNPNCGGETNYKKFKYKNNN